MEGDEGAAGGDTADAARGDGDGDGEGPSTACGEGWRWPLADGGEGCVGEDCEEA